MRVSLFCSRGFLVPTSKEQATVQCVGIAFPGNGTGALSQGINSQSGFALFENKSNGYPMEFTSLLTVVHLVNPLYVLSCKVTGIYTCMCKDDDDLSSPRVVGVYLFRCLESRHQGRTDEGLVFFFLSFFLSFSFY